MTHPTPTGEERKCTGAHCKCMDIGGQCPNMHWYHCKDHNPNAKAKTGSCTICGQDTLPGDKYRCTCPERQKDGSWKAGWEEKFDLVPHGVALNPSGDYVSVVNAKNFIRQFRTNLLRGIEEEIAGISWHEDFEGGLRKEWIPRDSVLTLIRSHMKE